MTEVGGPTEQLGSITELLQAWRGGDQMAFSQATTLVYAELRRLASSYLRREIPNHTLQPTALIHEAFLRLMGQREKVDWESRKHFLNMTAQLMRQILVDYARRRKSAKRGYGLRLEMDESRMPASLRSADLVALDDALNEFAKIDPRKARVVELRYFGGLQIQEIADLLDIHVNTVRRDLHVALCWLKASLARNAK